MSIGSGICQQNSAEIGFVLQLIALCGHLTQNYVWKEGSCHVVNIPVYKLLKGSTVFYFCVAFVMKVHVLILCTHKKCFFAAQAS